MAADWQETLACFGVEAEIRLAFRFPWHAIGPRTRPAVFAASQHARDPKSVQEHGGLGNIGPSRYRSVLEVTRLHSIRIPESSVVLDWVPRATSRPH